MYSIANTRQSMKIVENPAIDIKESFISLDFSNQVSMPFSDNGSKKPKVGLDCLSLPRYFSGAAYYIYYLTCHLLMKQRNHGYVIFCKPRHVSLFQEYLSKKDAIVSVNIKSRVHQLLTYEFRLRSIIRKHDVQLFHATHYLTPKPHSSYQIINTFHDLGYLTYPKYYALLRRSYFKVRMRTFLKRSRKLIAVSQSTANAIHHFFPRHSKEIFTIHPGTDHLKQIEQEFEIQNGKTPFILSVNSFEKRKNFPFIIDVFNCLKKDYNIPHKLILVGPPTNGYQSIQKFITKSHYKREIVIRHNLPLQQIRSLYHQADFFLSASTYEGFGFTPFEAISMDCPTFLLRNHITDEILGSQPYIFSELNTEKWAKTIMNEMKNGYINRVSSKSTDKLTWHRTAQNIIELHNNLLRQRTHVHD
ncbi:MAG: glycosyltransferase [Caldithrix sp.]|nr:glycosyltransferase [Caldithrix sp.]